MQEEMRDKDPEPLPSKQAANPNVKNPSKDTPPQSSSSGHLSKGHKYEKFFDNF